MPIQERQEVFPFLLKYVFNEVTTDRDQLDRKQQHTLKRSFFSFLGFKKLMEKSGPTLSTTSNAEEGFTLNSVPSAEHGRQYRASVIMQVQAFSPKLSNSFEIR